MALRDLAGDGLRGGYAEGRGRTKRTPLQAFVSDTGRSTPLSTPFPTFLLTQCGRWDRAKQTIGLPDEAFALPSCMCCHLTEADIGELGLPTGARRRLVVAIQALGTAVHPQPLVRSTDHTAPALGAERRQLTVMFCDLVGSPELATKLDPEPLRELMHAYQQTCSKVIERYEGHVAQYLGDGLMVYFGWPRAHEDDAERAVRSGLEIVETVQAIRAASTLHVRVGIATGAVVVGETGAGDASVPKAAVGESSSGATTRLACYLSAGNKPARVRVRWCCCQASPVLAKAASPRFFASGLSSNRTRAYATNARPTTSAPLSIRSSINWSAQRASSVTTHQRSGSTRWRQHSLYPHKNFPQSPH